MKQKPLLKMMLLLCALVAGVVNGRAAEGDEITSINKIVDGGNYYIKGVRSDNTYYLTFADNVGTSQSGTEASDKSSAQLITFEKQSDGLYYLKTASGHYIAPGTSNGKIQVLNSGIAVTATNQSSKIRLSITVDGATWSIQKNTQAANFGGYKNTQADITLVEGPSYKPTAGLSFGNDEGNTFTVLPNASFTAPTLANPNALTVTYNSSDAEIAAVSTTGAITIGTKEGTATITASSAETEVYAAGEAKYYIKVEKGTTTVTLSNPTLTFNIVDGTPQTLTATAKYGETALNDPAVTWSTSNSSVATVEAGVVTAVAPGTANITASYAGNTIYAASSNVCAVTVSKANTTLSLNEATGAIDLKNVGNRTFTLTPTVKAIKSDNTEVDVSSPTVTWTSSDNTVATVADGVVTGLKVGTATITASYAGGTDYNAAESATCTVTVSDTRDAVNMTAVSAVTNPIVKNNATSITVTNDQSGWTPAYTYTSSATDVAEIAADGTITAKEKGTATITATLNVGPDDPNYKAGTTTSMYFTLTVTNAFHTVTFSVNGNTDRTAEVEEGATITFPTAADSPADASQFDKVINGQTFVGWSKSTCSDADTAPNDLITAATTTMEDNADVTYYAVFADATVSESDELSKATLGQTLQYDTWSYSGSTTDMNTYRMFHKNSYIESAAFDLSKLMKVVVYGGYYGGTSFTSLTITDGTNKWKDVNVSGNKENKANEFSGGESLSGIKPLRIVSNNGSATTPNGVRISKVEIFVKGTVTTYEHFTTTVSALPRPEITIADVEMTWGDDDKYVTPSATVGEEAYSGSFTYTSDNDNLTVGENGKLTCNVPGTYHVTASIAATAEHQVAEKTCTVTVNKKDITLLFAQVEVIKMTDESPYTQTATVAPAEYNGTVSYAISGTGTATLNASTAEVTFTATGVNTITATATATDLYNGNTAFYTLKVKTTPTITVTDQTLAVGETYEPTITGGAVTIEGSPAGLFTLSGNVLTAKAIGTTTVTVTTAADDTYIEGSAQFTLTVNGEPEGLEELPEPEPEVVFYESFNRSTGSMASDWAGSSGSGSISADNNGWSYSDSKGGAGGSIKLGKSSGNGYATTPSITVETGTTYTLSFRAAPWGTDASTTMTLTVTGGDISGLSNEAMTAQQWNDYSATITATSSTMTIKFDASTDRFFLDEVRVTGPGESITSVSVAIPNGGFATYCSQYPLNLPADNENYEAYIVSEVEGTKVTFSKISGEIKGGVPFVLYGTPGNYNLPTASSSSTVPAGNLLSGTLAPKYVSSTDDDYCFGISKSSGKFVLITGILPANKAYLTVAKSIVDASLGTRELSIVFDESGTMGIDTMPMNSESTNGKDMFDLQGRKVAHPSKGLYIVNGRKVWVK